MKVFLGIVIVAAGILIGGVATNYDRIIDNAPFITKAAHQKELKAQAEEFEKYKKSQKEQFAVVHEILEDNKFTLKTSLLYYNVLAREFDELKQDKESLNGSH